MKAGLQLQIFLSKDGLESPMEFIYIDAPGIGETTGKFAVIK